MKIFVDMNHCGEMRQAGIRRDISALMTGFNSYDGKAYLSPNPSYMAHTMP